MDVTFEDLRLISTSEEHSRKTPFSMDVKSNGNSMLLREVQPRNAPTPMDVKEDEDSKMLVVVFFMSHPPRKGLLIES